MSLGFDAISTLPFAASGNEGNVNVNVTKNELTITIGSVGIIADSIVEDPDPNRLTLGLGTLTISGKANVTVTKNELSLGLGTITVTAAANVTATKNELTLATGNVSITGTALVNPTGSGLTLSTNDVGIITWNEIIPGATMVWTPIKPY